MWEAHVGRPTRTRLLAGRCGLRVPLFLPEGSFSPADVTMTNVVFLEFVIVDRCVPTVLTRHSSVVVIAGFLGH